MEANSNTLLNYGNSFTNLQIIERIKERIKEKFDLALKSIKDNDRYSKEMKSNVTERIERWPFFEKFPGAQPVSFDIQDLCEI